MPDDPRGAPPPPGVPLDALRERSRQEYLAKRSQQQVELLRREIQDEETFFRGVKLTKKEQRELDHKKELLRLAEEHAALEKEVLKELLLPGFDELVLGYRDRLYLMDQARHDAITPGNNGVFRRTALRRGEVVGTWAPKGSAARRRLDLTALRPVSEAQHRRFERLFHAFPFPG